MSASENPAIGHTLHRYDEELLAIHGTLLQMGGDVITQAKHALAALLERDLDLARAVIERDRAIDLLEIDIDEELVKILARRAPVARDLRLIMAISKAVTDLERTGDKAVKIADRSLQFYQASVKARLPDDLLEGIERFGKTAVRILEEVVQSFACFDLTRTEQVLQNINAMENEFQASLRRLIDLAWRHSGNQANSIGMVFVIQCLDRIVDHSENIAEHLVFLIRGEDIRHADG